MDDKDQANEPTQVEGTVGPEKQLPPDQIDKEAKQWAMFAHLASLAGYTGIPLANVLGPLIIWMIKKDEYPFVDDQGKEALNFQISVTIYLIVSALLICVFVGFVLLPAIAIADLVLTIIAAINANAGTYYRYPLTIRLIK